uniref:Uncharacterized protein n=1 Tax=Caenorhabditis japonica TaxID=281687 RepID=A0A8R1DQP2_CAEJA
MSKTGGNTEPMPFIRKWGVEVDEDGNANGDSMTSPALVAPPMLSSGNSDPARPSSVTDSPSRSEHRSSKRDRSRSPRDRDRKKDRKKKDRSRSRDRDRDRSRSRDRDRDRDRDSRRRRSSRSPRRRSRSRDRKERRRERERTPPSMVPNSPHRIKEPVINPLIREDLAAAAVSGEVPVEAVQAGAVVSLNPAKKERKSRWSTTKSFVPGMPTILPSDLTEDQRNAYLCKILIFFLMEVSTLEGKVVLDGAETFVQKEYTKWREIEKRLVFLRKIMHNG